MKKKSISLLGFMGAGKTTVGSLLAREFGIPFVDLDQMISSCAGKPIPDIFREDGETYFRELESRLLGAELNKGAVVLSTGGGVVEWERNRALISEKSVGIYLEAQWETLVSRVGKGEGRPLAKDPDEMKQRFDTRLKLYKQAEMTVQTDGLTPDQVVKTILCLLETIEGE